MCHKSSCLFYTILIVAVVGLLEFKLIVQQTRFCSTNFTTAWYFCCAVKCSIKMCTDYWFDINNSANPYTIKLQWYSIRIWGGVWFAWRRGILIASNRAWEQVANEDVPHLIKVSLGYQAESNGNSISEIRCAKKCKMPNDEYFIFEED